MAHAKSAGSLTNFEVLAKLLAKSKALPRYSEPSSCPKNSFLSDTLPLSASLHSHILFSQKWHRNPDSNRILNAKESPVGSELVLNDKTEIQSTAE